MGGRRGGWEKEIEGKIRKIYFAIYIFRFAFSSHLAGIGTDAKFHARRVRYFDERMDNTKESCRISISIGVKDRSRVSVTSKFELTRILGGFDVHSYAFYTRCIFRALRRGSERRHSETQGDSVRSCKFHLNRCNNTTRSRRKGARENCSACRSRSIWPYIYSSVIYIDRSRVKPFSYTCAHTCISYVYIYIHV